MWLGSKFQQSMEDLAAAAAAAEAEREALDPEKRKARDIAHVLDGDRFHARLTQRTNKKQREASVSLPHRRRMDVAREKNKQISNTSEASVVRWRETWHRSLTGVALAVLWLTWWCNVRCVGTCTGTLSVVA